MNRENVVVYGSWCVTLPSHAPDLDENGGIIYEEKEIHHKDGTVTMENVPRMHEIFFDEEQTKEFFHLSYEFMKNRYGEGYTMTGF